MTALKLASRGLLAAALLAGLAGAAHAADDIDRVNLEGTLGQERIGMSLLVKNGKSFDGGHYFYGRYLKDIPLRGKLQGETLLLSEPSGGVFKLRFKSNGSADGQPLSFDNSVGLDGDWTLKTKTLPVTLTMGDMAPASEGRWYRDVTEESDAAFEARVQGFLRAALAGEAQQASRYVHFPLRINHKGGSRQIANTRQLQAEWSDIFTPAYLEQLKQPMPHNLFVRNGQAMLGSGVAWFDAKGAAALNLPD
ncbi:hypothetical protein [Chromobacterium haemolyticum]|uniref:Uncharacterized protein n=1 Tax=Chromobacterium haemolyticum TaxID=394935 RepID=A0A1W0CMN0_9NEIS|nr:hypothetical protein [Chromobacterium haemolyticum]OQS36070.1 hypothetical protein B0T45_16400 [Chromobacterium haemolyticum]